MIDFIYLKKSGFYTHFANKYLKIDKPISYYLHHTPVFEKGFSVLHLMQILKEYEQEVDLIFMAYSRGFKIDPFYQEMMEPIETHIKKGFSSDEMKKWVPDNQNLNTFSKKKDNESKIDYLEFSWSGNIHNLKEFGKPKYEMSDYVHITGKVYNSKERYGFGLDNLSEIKDTTFKLDTGIEFKTIDFGEIWDENRKPVTQLFFKGIKPFVFENIIGTFIHEMTCYGYKEHKTKFIERLEKSSEESKLGGGTLHQVMQLKWSKRSLLDWQNKKDSKNKTLKIEKLEKEIRFLEIEIEKLKIEYKDNNYNWE